jgi:hypothetical protein
MTNNDQLDPNAGVQPEEKVEAPVEANSDSEVGINYESENIDSVRVAPELMNDDEPETDAQTEPEPETDAQTEPETDAQTEPELDSDLLIQPMAELPQREPETQVKNLSNADLEVGIKILEEQRTKYFSEIEELERHREAISVDIERFISVREDLNQWINARKESFAWKLTETLRGHEKQLAADEARVRDFTSNPPEIDIEFAAKTRLWVLKSIGIPALILVSIFVIMETFRANSGYVDSADPNNPAATIQIRKFDSWLLENLGLTHLQVTFMLSIVMVSTFVGVLFAYSRRSSEFRQLVAEEAQLTKVMEQAVHSIKGERERIDSLHPQVPQILELLSLGLHQPWVIDSRFLAFQGVLPDASKLPESLDVSVPTEKSSQRVFPQLVLRAMNQIQQPGWREQAFENAIQRLAESAGFGESDGAIRELDQDQRRSGKRQMLISLADKNSVLNAIGEKMVKEFAATVQSKVLPFAQPEVISLRPDVLSHLQLTDDLVGTSEEDVSPWEQRLSEIAGAGSPWAPGTFSARGQMAARHEKKPDSVFIATDRATQYAHKEVNVFKEVYAGTRPFEVSIRVDLSEWCHPEELAIFQDYLPSAQEILERESREPKEAPSDIATMDPFNDSEVAF